MEKLFNFIDGKFCSPVTNEFFQNIDPSNGKAYSLVPNSGEQDIHLAVLAAKRAFKSWRNTSRENRSKYLGKIAHLIDKNLESLAEAESRDQGKPVHLAQTMDIPRAAANFRFFAGSILHESQESYTTSNTTQNYTLRVPVGVAGLISPWNLPLYLLTWKIAPALAAGNTVVCKPSEVTPYTAYKLGQLIKESGLPDGVCNIVFGTGNSAGSALVKHPEVPLLSFTGGTRTAEVIAKDAAPFAKKLSLELGGKNPAIIFDDCDLDQAITQTVRSSFLNQGEICLCTSRILVHRTIFDAFTKRFVDEAKALRVGLPHQSSSFMGPVVSQQHLEKIKSYIEMAREEDATILTGGDFPKVDGGCEGYYVNPTVITGIGEESRLFHEEIFGPIVCITPFVDMYDAIRLANQTKYGLAATIWTTNIHTAHKLAAEVDAGQVWINTWMNRDLRVPFGGMKQSGVGREGGRHSLEFYTEEKNICFEIF